MFIFISTIIFILDQAIKFLVHRFFLPNQSIPIINGFLHLTYVQNQGVAFGLLRGWKLPIILVGFSVLIVVLYISRQVKKNDFMQIPLAFIFGGSLGNLFDRIFRGFVVDYIDFRFFPVFNLADTMINVGVFLIIARILLNKDKNAS